MCKVAEIMTRKVLTVAAEADLEDAAWGLTLKRISGAPVKDKWGNVIGVLSKSDLLDPNERDLRSDESPKARDVMTPVLFAARETDPVGFAVRRMVETGVHRLVVLDERGILIGVVTPMDVLRGLLEGKVDARDFNGTV